MTKNRTASVRADKAKITSVMVEMVLPYHGTSEYGSTQETLTKEDLHSDTERSVPNPTAMLRLWLQICKPGVCAGYNICGAKRLLVVLTRTVIPVACERPFVLFQSEFQTLSNELHHKLFTIIDSEIFKNRKQRIILRKPATTVCILYLCPKFYIEFKYILEKRKCACHAVGP